MQKKPKHVLLYELAYSDKVSLVGGSAEYLMYSSNMCYDGREQMATPLKKKALSRNASTSSPSSEVAWTPSTACG